MDYIYLVGGFAESKMLQTRVKVEFERPGVRVIVPMRPQLMVVKGAVIFGLQKGSTIQSRKARFTYGFSTGVDYNVRDPEHAKRGRIIINKRKIVAVDGFESLVKEGHSIKILETHSSEGKSPLSPDQTSAVFKLFSSSNPRAKFTDDPGLTYIGEVRVPCIYGQTLTVAMAFGSTEITATATNKTTGAIVKGEINYNFNSL